MNMSRQAPPKEQRAATVLFSGGIDSTAAVFSLAHDFTRLDLVTFSHGYGQYHLKRTHKRFQILQQMLPGTRLSHRIIAITPLFKKLVTDNLEHDYQNYRSGFIWCLGCKLAMHAHAIIYAAQNAIACVADGSSLETAEMVEQMPSTITHLKSLYAAYHIEYMIPGYTESRAYKIALLAKKGLTKGIRIRDRFLGIQPRCIPGELYYLPFVLFHQPVQHVPVKIAAFIDEKWQIASAYIKDALHETVRNK